MLFSFRRILSRIARQICYSHPNNRVMKPPIPLNEHARLELLRQYGILDTAAEPAFDEITARAADICQTPISLLTFVERDRTWFKSNIGLEFREIPRDNSFCAHAICQDELYVSPDMLADERFSHNPLVTQKPHLRFYAGMPLLSPEGLALGTLCVIDRKPRELSAEQTDKLKELAKGAILLLEVRRAGGRPPARP
jgi:GAF domain-containing protein